ncbi:MAG: PQQ-binding-like beta-propeller repeat protein [Methanocella sp.]
MQKSFVKISFSLALILLMALPIIAIPAADAHTPAWEIETWAYISVAPDPVGVGQKVYVNMWVDKPMPGATIFNDIRRHNYELTITKPDNTTEKHKFDLSDSTGVQFYVFTPDQVGEYAFSFYYPGQVYTWSQQDTPGLSASDAIFQNDTFKPATSKTVYLTVQQEPIPEAKGSYPLPTEYWSRPIEGQNTEWYTISSNYLRGAQIIDGAVQPGGSAPETAHVMWSKPLEAGGVVGGTNTGIDGMTYYSGLSYETRYTGTIIMNGRLYYPLTRSNNGAGNGYVVVDLQTGEEIYTSTMAMPAFGQLEWFDSENQHGVIPSGYLWYSSGTTRMIYDANDGKWLFNITGVPSGTMEYGPNGEILIYTLNVANKWLAMWNFTECFPRLVAHNAYRPVGQVIDGSKAYSWNVSLSNMQAGSTIRYTLANDILLFSNIGYTLAGRYGTTDPYTVGAISLKPESRGHLMWMKNYSAPQPATDTIGATQIWLTADPINRVFMMRNKEELINYGYSFENGELVWTTQRLDNVPDWEYFSTSGFTAYGKLYYSGYGGILYAFDTKDGKLLWTYGNGGEGNSTNTGLQTPWGLYPINIGTIADGKIYTFGSEHSPNEPMYKDIYVRCIDAFNGTEYWKILSYANPGSFMAPGFAIADGYMAYLNLYDHQMYVIGKGPSKTTVEAQPKITTLGSSVLIEGTVIDTAAGTQQEEQIARFPNGVPAVSDESMGPWMEYVYMQKPRPTNVVGVTVELSIVDANGNYRTIGTTTADADGFFSFNWTPDIEGKYTVYANFAGSKSYWSSHAVTAFNVDPAPATPTPQPTQSPSMADLYFMPMSVAILVAIIVATVVIVLALKKRP